MFGRVGLGKHRPAESSDSAGKLIVQPSLAVTFERLADKFGVAHSREEDDGTFGRRTSVTVQFEPWFGVAVHTLYQFVARKRRHHHHDRVTHAFYIACFATVDRDMLEAAYRIGGRRAMDPLLLEHVRAEEWRLACSTNA